MEETGDVEFESPHLRMMCLRVRRGLAESGVGQVLGDAVEEG
jgi:hypothetical protein